MVGIGSVGVVLFVPQGYISGTSLASTNTWANQSFASLGLTPGTYTWTWGSGAHADRFILQIGPASVLETRSTLMLLSAAVGTLATLRRKLAAVS